MSSHKMIKINEVINSTGLSRSTIYSFINLGIFPSQIKLGLRSVAWIEHEVDEWLAQRILQSRTNSKEVA